MGFGVVGVFVREVVEWGCVGGKVGYMFSVWSRCDLVEGLVLLVVLLWFLSFNMILSFI